MQGDTPKNFKFKLPNLDKKYDGLNNPYDHVTNCQTIMNFQEKTNDYVSGLLYPDLVLQPAL